MQKKIISLLMLISIFVFIFNFNSYANENGKTIFISMNKTNIDDMQMIPILNEKLSKEGYIGLMNVRGDGGSDDKRAYATIGSGSRAYISSSNYIDFSEATEKTSILYKSAVGEDGKYINNLGINILLNNNESKGQYGAKLGNLGQILIDNNLSIAVLGNADIGLEYSDLNRNISLIAMDSLGRIEDGNIDDINIEDKTMPYGIRTDYAKLILETKKYYDNKDVLFIELGDTTRLNSYKSVLNEKTFSTMKKSIYKNIDTYLKAVFSLVNSNDTIYIVSPTVSTLDSSQNKRLAPVIKFDGNGKGLLCSATTRRDGIVANVDISSDILNKYHITSSSSVGKIFKYSQIEDNIDYLKKDFNKIVSMTNTRSTVVTIFVSIIVISWLVAMFALILKDRFPAKNKEVLFMVLKELIKLGLVMPLAFLIAPLSNASSNSGITISVIVSVIMLYTLAHLLFKGNDLKQMALYSLLIISVLSIDCIFGTYLIKNNIMSYDAMIGARYYGIGNEYEGVAVASIIFGLAVLLHYNKKVSKMLIGLFMVISLITSAHPSMGANVGGTISQSVAYLLFMLLILDKKIDLKKVLLIICAVCLIVGGFAISDILSGTESHLSLFINQIIENGPMAIMQTFGRKISMNIKLAKSSIWVNILLVGIIIIATLIFKPKSYFKKISKDYPIIFKGFIASIIGCFTTLLVNDSGIVSASTASIYVLIPLIIIIINKIIYNKNE